MESEFRVKVEVPAKILMLRPLGVFVRSLIQQLPVNIGESSELTDRVELAFSEAFTNICRHAYGADRQGPALIEIILTSDKLEFVFVDYGQGFDPDKIQCPNLDEPREGGLGLWLMKQVMDEYHYHSEEGVRNVLRLIKRLSTITAAGQDK
jgi:serine/threonine-protein kinase RsbW